ncbi:uncharacterized protein LOC117335477 [Pecten maximus]|uniref:uncharacterized protein LOC117335477 n=1 Tax=Pecten maximus TaxID=6579 RepID=UPI001458C001|nr:uncharacterized protein LOC117335477 [Pecten maximus]
MAFYVIILVLAATTCKDMSSLASTTTAVYTTAIYSKPAIDMPTTSTECVDVFHHCETFSTTACDANHQTWAKKYCAKYCKLCDDSCVDLEPNCETFGLAACQMAFSSWATKNCARFCGICVSGDVPTPPSAVHPSRAGCHDAQDCTAYSHDVCTKYEIWARQHCALYCGFCS